MTRGARALEQQLSKLTENYPPTSYPALAHQLAEWRAQRPLAGLKVLDSTPVFRNTVLKHRNLVAAGAELTVAVGALDPCDPHIVAELKKLDVPVCETPPVTETFDVVLDCAGCHKQVPSQLGYVELTRSGIHAYGEIAARAPVLAADSGRIKAIETSLGTGESFLRAFQTLNTGPVAGRKFVIFGYGKVGRGMVYYLRRAKAEVTVIDFAAELAALPPAVCGVNVRDRAAVDAALRGAFCVVAATGVRHALAGRFDAAALAASETIIALMGVEDEFGPALDEKRVLNGKRPLNFILAEPTRLEYIETTMALHNAGAVELLKRGGKPGMFVPSRELEEALLADAVRGDGGVEIAALLKELENR